MIVKTKPRRIFVPANHESSTDKKPRIACTQVCSTKQSTIYTHMMPLPLLFSPSPLRTCLLLQPFPHVDAHDYYCFLLAYHWNWTKFFSKRARDYQIHHHPELTKSTTKSSSNVLRSKDSTLDLSSIANLSAVELHTWTAQTLTLTLRWTLESSNEFLPKIDHLHPMAMM